MHGDARHIFRVFAVPVDCDIGAPQQLGFGARVTKVSFDGCEAAEVADAVRRDAAPRAHIRERVVRELRGGDVLLVQDLTARAAPGVARGCDSLTQLCAPMRLSDADDVRVGRLVALQHCARAAALLPAALEYGHDALKTRFELSLPPPAPGVRSQLLLEQSLEGGCTVSVLRSSAAAQPALPLSAAECAALRAASRAARGCAAAASSLRK